MASIIIMPKQGLQMEEGTITSWLVNEGEECIEGQPLFEMETDKLTITMDSTATGTLLKIIHPEGDTVRITQPIAIVGKEGEDISALIEIAPEDSFSNGSEEVISHQDSNQETAMLIGRNRVFSSPRARKTAEETGVNINHIEGRGPEGIVIERDVLDFVENQPIMTPLAKKVAEADGVDSNLIRGTGSYGRIVVEDLYETNSEDRPSIQYGENYWSKPMSNMRSIVASNMKRSLDTMAQANHRMDVDMTACIELRSEYKKNDLKVSYNDIIMRCCAKALREIPEMNASIDISNKAIVYHNEINIGNAVAMPGGLIVPVIRDADKIGIEGIAKKSQELVMKARENTLMPEDYTGGTFTVSSLGMYDVDSFTAIINPPEAGILGVGKIIDKPVVLNSEIVIRPMCTLSLTYDHQLIDGADAAKFLQRIKAYLQNPVLML